MDNEKFDRSMEKLKKKYDEVESTTSPQAIIQAIQLEKNNRKKRHYLSGIAASIVALLIGGFLFSSLMYTDQASNGDKDGENVASNHMNDDGVNDPVNDPDEITENEPEEDESEGNTAEQDDLESHGDQQRPETKELTVYPEGMAETIQMIHHVSENLGYATYIEENMIVIETNENGKDVDYFYVDFAETGEIAFEEVFIRVEKFTDTSVEEVEGIIFEKIEANGFTFYEFNDEDIEPLDNATKHLLFVSNDLTHYLTMIENGDHVYAVQTQMLVEMSDGSFPWIMEEFVNEIIFVQ